MVKQPKITNNLSKSYRKYKGLYISGIAIISVFLIAGFMTGFRFGIFGSAEVVEEETPTLYGFTNFNITNAYNNSELDEATYDVYGLDVSDYTEAEKLLVDINDMALIEAVLSSKPFTPKADFIYEVWINETGYWPMSLSLIDGYSIVELVPTCTDVALLMYGTVTLNSTVNSTDVLRTVIAQCYDDDDGLTTGFKPYYDPFNGEYVNLMISFGFNDTIQTSSIKSDDSIYQSEIVNNVNASNYYFEFNQEFFQTPFNFNIEFDEDAIAVDWVLTNCSIGYGSSGSDMTIWTTISA